MLLSLTCVLVGHDPYAYAFIHTVLTYVRMYTFVHIMPIHVRICNSCILPWCATAATEGAARGQLINKAGYNYYVSW